MQTGALAEGLRMGEGGESVRMETGSGAPAPPADHNNSGKAGRIDGPPRGGGGAAGAGHAALTDDPRAGGEGRARPDSAAGGQEPAPASQHATACAAPQTGAAHRSGSSASAASQPGEKRCSYERCTRPTVTRQFHTITQSSKLAGGHSKWGAVMGMTLCDACYTAFSRRGTLGREPRNHTLKSEERRCSYELCARPTESRQFHKISEAGKSVGGHDWSPVVGKVLCNACYTAFSRHGTLDRIGQTPREKIPQEERRCCNGQCAHPTQSGQFHKIARGFSKGGRDWAPVEGKVLCHACYAGFLKRGSLAPAHGSLSASPTGLPAAAEPPRCSYKLCANPTEGCRYFRIKDGCRAGGKDWGPVVGRTLCETCYGAYSKHGTLDRQVQQPAEDLAEEERRCAYEHCMWSTERSPFYRIQKGCTTMGRDWSSLDGQVLCQACFMSWSNRGTLEREPAQAQAGDCRCSYDKCPRPRGSSKYHTIREGCKAGAQDWGELVGMVLCNPCYSNFRTAGTLERRRGDSATPDRARDGKVRKRRKPEAEEQLTEELADDGDVDSLGTDLDDHEGTNRPDKVVCRDSSYDMPPSAPSHAVFEVGNAVLALYKDGRWYRAEVVRVMGAAKSYEIKWKGAGNGSRIDTIKLPREIKYMPRWVADPASFGGSQASNGSSTAGVSMPPPARADKKKGEGSDSDCKRKERSEASQSAGLKAARREGMDGAKGERVKGDACGVCDKGLANFCVTPCMHKVLCSQCADASKFTKEDTRPISRCPKCSSPVESPYYTLSTGLSC